MGKKKIVWMRSVWCKSAREHPDLSPSTALRRCFVVCLSVYLVVASSFKQNSRSQPQLVFLQVCFYLVHFFMCAGLFPAQRANRHNPRSFNASGDKSLDERQLDRCYQCRSPIYHCNSLLLGREENTITRPMTLLVFRFLFVFTLSCCDQDHNKKKKRRKRRGRRKKETGAILKVMTKWSRCSSNVCWAVYFHKIVKKKSHQHFDVLKGRKHART